GPSRTTGSIGWRVGSRSCPTGCPRVLVRLTIRRPTASCRCTAMTPRATRQLTRRFPSRSHDRNPDPPTRDCRDEDILPKRRNNAADSTDSRSVGRGRSGAFRLPRSAVCARREPASPIHANTMWATLRAIIGTKDPCHMRTPHIIGVAGWSGSGKTTLITQLIPLLIARQLTVSTIKHAHHAFDIDLPGKDSYEHRSAGATDVLVTSAHRWALMHELRGAPEPDLRELLATLRPVNLVIIEGFKRTTPVEIEVYRSSLGKPLICLTIRPWSPS